MYTCLFRKNNPLLYEVESLNVSDLQIEHPNKREKSKTQKILHQGVRNGGWKMQSLTYMGEHIEVIIY